ncbi:unnamed protein product [Pleuronectes platessa]|uniref:Secreted protein n=1 Tax=Pleuronectes platessa TaxID=8262 RepID=A0A9N7YIH4_PLEPL|nr:unnamed protein product [Pleuronectes platessa]
MLLLLLVRILWVLPGTGAAPALRTEQLDTGVLDAGMCVSTRPLHQNAQCPRLFVLGGGLDLNVNTSSARLSPATLGSRHESSPLLIGDSHVESEPLSARGRALTHLQDSSGSGSDVQDVRVWKMTRWKGKRLRGELLDIRRALGELYSILVSVGFGWMPRHTTAHRERATSKKVRRLLPSVEPLELRGTF